MITTSNSPTGALKQIVGSGMGTVLSCIPGRLAFVETEDERFILERHDALEKREYVRFVIGRKDEESHVEQGIFQAAAQAVEWENITGSDADELNELRAWFSENLEKPTSFGRDKLRLGAANREQASVGRRSPNCPQCSTALGAPRLAERRRSDPYALNSARGPVPMHRPLQFNLIDRCSR